MHAVLRKFFMFDFEILFLNWAKHTFCLWEYDLITAIKYAKKNNMENLIKFCCCFLRVYLLGMYNPCLVIKLSQRSNGIYPRDKCVCMKK